MQRSDSEVILIISQSFTKDKVLVDFRNFDLD